MTDDFTTEALQYLLEEMAPERRAAFEARLARDPVAAAAFKTCADALANFALEGAAAEPLLGAERGEMKAAMRSATADSIPAPVAAARRARPPRPGWIWPAAAGLLLAINLWQWFRSHPGGVAAGRPDSGRAAVVAAPTDAPIPPGRLFATSPGLVDAGPNAAVARAREGKPTEEAIRVQALRSQIAQLEANRDAIAKEYRQIAAQLAQSGAVRSPSGKLVAMELVDAASYANGSRNGLVDAARTILTAPGIVALDPLTPPNSTAAAGAGNSVALNTTTMLGATSSSAASSASILTQTLLDGDTITVANTGLPSGGGSNLTTIWGSSEAFTSLSSGPLSTGSTITLGTSGSTISTPASSAPSAPASAPSTYAWSVFDENASQGYLNLYNLPSVAADQALQLWIMPQNSDSFQLVGEVPDQFYGQSGSLVYKLAPNTLTPTQLLITIEPRNTPLVAPTGPTVLRGP